MAPSQDFQGSVIATCANPLPCNLVNPRIIKTSDHRVVKWGPDVTKNEAENQRIAHELVDKPQIGYAMCLEKYPKVSLVSTGTQPYILAKA